MKDIKRDIVDRIMDFLSVYSSDNNEIYPSSVIEVQELLLEAKEEIVKLRKVLWDEGL